MITKLEYTELQKKALSQSINQEYFSAVIDLFKNSSIPMKSSIQKMFARLQSQLTSMQCVLKLGAENTEELVKGIAQFLKIEAFEKMTPLMNFCILYLDKKVQEQKFPGIEGVLIQTTCRELFHDYLNPLPQFKYPVINSNAINPAAREGGKNLLNAFPIEIQNLIYSHMDPQTKFSLGKTCEEFYFFHKTRINQSANILYVLGDDLRLDRPRRFMEKNDFVYFREEIPSEEIRHSLSSTKQTNFKAFSSLYHAVEYLHFLKRWEVHAPWPTKKDIYIPSLWAVAYAGNFAKLFKKSECIEIAGWSTSARASLVDYAEIPKDSFVPLLGAVLNTSDDFGDYKIFNQVNSIKKSAERDDPCLIS